MNTYFNDSDFELEKVVVALTKNVSKENLFTYDINHIFNGIDIEIYFFLTKQILIVILEILY